MKRITASWLNHPERKPETKTDFAMARADSARSGAHFLSNPRKTFQNQTKAKFWGIEVDGECGVVGPGSLPRGFAERGALDPALELPSEEPFVPNELANTRASCLT